MKNEQFRNGMTAIAELKEMLYGGKTQLTKEECEILQKVDQIHMAYENLFIAYAREKMNLTLEMEDLDTDED